MNQIYKTGIEMSFFRQLSRGANKFFGRQLPSATRWFGKQLSTGSRKMASGIGQAQGVISSLEKATKDIPVLGDVYKLSGVGLSGLQNLANSGQTAGTALQQLGSGNLKGAYQSGKQLYGQGGGLVKSGEDFAKAGLPLLAFL
jgi:hypothetical protein